MCFGEYVKPVTYSEFTKLADILNESVLADKKFGQTLDYCVSCSMLFGFWKDVVGKRFEKVSVPYEFKNSVLYVSVMSPVVTQELSMFKADIIKKYEPYAQGLNFVIKEIRFDYKNWFAVKKSIDNANGSNAFDADSPEYYTEKDYEAIGLDNDEKLEFEKLRKSFDNNVFLPENVKEKMYNNAVIMYKAQKLRKMQAQKEE